MKKILLEEFNKLPLEERVKILNQIYKGNILILNKQYDK